MRPIALSVRGVQLGPLDLAIVCGASAAFVAGFLPWWGGALDLVGSVSVEGWSAGFTAWAGVALLTGAGALVLLRRAGVSSPSVAVGPSTLVAGISAIGLVLVVIRWLSLHRHLGLGVDVGARYGIYIALIAGIIEVAAAVLEMRSSGEPLHWSPRGDADAVG